ncbi:MAG TPA: sulfatase [Gemmatimonadales bacterium]
MSRRTRRPPSDARAVTSDRPAEPIGSDAAVRPLTAGQTLRLAASAGVLTGVAEVLWVSTAISVGVQVRLSAHYVWMVTAADVLFAVAVALVLLALSRWRPRARSPRVVAGVLVGLAVWELLLLFESLYPAAGAVLAAGIGVTAARMVGKRVARTAYRMFPMAALGLAVIVAWLGVRMTLSLHASDRAALRALPVPRADTPNVLLLILDTVRAKGLLADGRYTVPQLQCLAERGVSFERAMAPAPWTLPSHASMFTGYWPNELSERWDRGLDATHPTLAEALARRGYRTGGFVANVLWTTRATGLGRGFVTYDDYPVNLGQVLLSSSLGRFLAGNSMLRKLAGHHQPLNRRSAAEVSRAFLAWQRQHDDRPFFAFLNFFDAHEPTFPPGYSGSLFWPGRRWTDFEHFASLMVGEAAVIRDKWTQSAEETDIFASGYDAAVRAVDAEVGSLLDELERRGVLRNTVVVITSDHGEQLGEHGLFEHNNSLYLPALHVPLLILPAGGRQSPISVPQVVSLRNIPATVLDLIGESPNEFPGRSLVPLWRTSGDGDPAAVAGDTAFAHLVGGYIGDDGRPSWYPVKRGREMFSLTTRRHHYILSGDGSEELYDWQNDPAESVNLAGREDADSLVAPFRGTLDAMYRVR